MANLPVIHPKFREWPTPAYGVTAERNPPTLMWPAGEGEPRVYAVRLGIGRSAKAKALGQPFIPFISARAHWNGTRPARTN